jgi:pyrrolidone-carboxylate peptidase
MDVCVYMCVCMFEHNSGTPGAISTKLGTHIAIYVCKNLMYALYTSILRREDGVGGREFG